MIYKLKMNVVMYFTEASVWKGWCFLRGRGGCFHVSGERGEVVN